MIEPRYCSAHDTRSKRPKGEPRYRQCSACTMLIETNCVDFSLCPTCSQRNHQCMICGSSAPGHGHLPAGQSPGMLDQTAAFDMSQVPQEPPVLPRGPPGDMSMLEVSRLVDSPAPR